MHKHGCGCRWNAAGRRSMEAGAALRRFWSAEGCLCARQPLMLPVCLQLETAAQVADAASTQAGESVDSAFQQPAAGQRDQSSQSREIDELKEELSMVRIPEVHAHSSTEATGVCHDAVDSSRRINMQSHFRVCMAVLVRCGVVPAAHLSDCSSDGWTLLHSTFTAAAAPCALTPQFRFADRGAPTEDLHAPWRPR